MIKLIKRIKCFFGNHNYIICAGEIDQKIQDLMLHFKCEICGKKECQYKNNSHPFWDSF